MRCVCVRARLCMRTHTSASAGCTVFVDVHGASNRRVEEAQLGKMCELFKSFYEVFGFLQLNSDFKVIVIIIKGNMMSYYFFILDLKFYPVNNNIEEIESALLFVSM